MKHSKIENKILSTKDQESIIKFSLDNSLDWKHRAMAIEMLNDTQVLLEIINNDELAPLRTAGKKRLLEVSLDEDLKAHFAINDDSWEVRISACKIIDDTEVLYAVLAVENDEFVRQAAKERLIELGVGPEYFQ